MSELLKQMADELYNGNQDAVAKLAQQMLDEGLAPADILNNGLVAGMSAVGKDFRDGILFIPDVDVPPNMINHVFVLLFEL